MQIRKAATNGLRRGSSASASVGRIGGWVWVGAVGVDTGGKGLTLVKVVVVAIVVGVGVLMELALWWARGVPASSVKRL